MTNGITRHIYGIECKIVTIGFLYPQGRFKENDIVHKLRMILPICLLYCSAVWADSSVRLLERTKSGRTAVISIGYLDGMQKGDRGILTLGDRKISRGKIVKTYNNRSVWFSSKIYNLKLFKIGEKFTLLDYDGQQARATEFKVKERLLVAKNPSEKAYADMLEDDRDGYSDQLVKNDGGYQQDDFFADDLEGDDDDLERVRIGEWDKANLGKHDRQVKERLRVVSKKKLKELYRNNRYNNRISNHLAGSKEQLNHNEFYKDQRRDPVTGHLQERASKSTLLARLLDQLKLEDVERSELLEKIEERVGLDWSDDMSDEDLSEFLRAKGIVREQLRQVSSISSQASSQFALDLGFPILDDVTAAASDSSEMKRYDLSFSAEFYPGKLLRQLDNVGFEASYRKSTDRIVVNNLLGKVTDYSWRLAMNFYPWNKPTALRTNVLILGAGIRRGSATIGLNGNSANYSLSSIPSLSGGIKYNLYSGLGFRVMGYIEPTSWSFESTTGSQPFPLSISRTNYKLSLGMTYIF